MNRSIVSGVPSVVSCPPSDWLVVVRIPNLGASIVIKEPSCIICDHLVVIIVEEVGPSRGPDVSEQRSVDVESAEGVSAHNGHSLLAREAKLLLEEGDQLLAVPHRVGVHLMLAGDVGSECIIRLTVRPSRSKDK